MEFDNVIIGTGFAAHHVAAFLPSSQTILIQPKSGDGESLKISATQQSVLDVTQVMKTKNFGGGKEVWGGAISHPNKSNYFRRTENSAWNQVGLEILTSVIQEQDQSLDQCIKMIEQIFPGLTSTLEVEEHNYITGFLGTVSEYKFPREGEHKVIEGSILRCNSTNQGRYECTILAPNGSTIDIRAHNVIFAAGNILNACYTSLLTGQSQFPIGNHASRNLGKVYFRGPVDLRDIAQLYEASDSKFLTFGNNGDSPGFLETANSIRLQVVDTMSCQRAAYEHLLRACFRTSVREKIATTKALCTAVKAKKRIVSEATVRLMTDLPTHDQQNYLKIISHKNGSWIAEVKLEISSSVQTDADLLLLRFSESALKSKLLSKIDFPRLTGTPTGSSGSQGWHDAAHYYGSVPVGIDSPDIASVDQNLQLRGHPNCYVLGASSFPTGSHGHPTKLIIDLAIRLGKHISEKNE